MPLEDLLQLFISCTRLHSDTVRVYRICLRQMTTCLGRPPSTADLTDATLLQFERWFAALQPPRSPYTVRERSGRIKALWRFAAKRGLVTTWPSLPPPPVPELRPRAWTLAELSTLVNAARLLPRGASWWEAWISTAYWTGERTGALRRLRWEHVDLGRCLLDLPGTIRKNGKAALYVLPAEAMALLVTIRTDSPLVFPWRHTDDYFHLCFNALLRTAGLPTGRRNQTQRIRRTHLTYWQLGGGNPTDRAQHSSAALTWKHYLDRSLLPLEKPEDRLPRIG